MTDHTYNATHQEAKTDYLSKHGKAARQRRARERNGEMVEPQSTDNLICPVHGILPKWECEFFEPHPKAA